MRTCLVRKETLFVETFLFLFLFLLIREREMTGMEVVKVTESE